MGNLHRWSNAVDLLGVNKIALRIAVFDIQKFPIKGGNLNVLRFELCLESRQLVRGCAGCHDGNRHAAQKCTAEPLRVCHFIFSHSGVFGLTPDVPCKGAKEAMHDRN